MSFTDPAGIFACWLSGQQAGRSQPAGSSRE